MYYYFQPIGMRFVDEYLNTIKLSYISWVQVVTNREYRSNNSRNMDILTWKNWSYWNRAGRCLTALALSLLAVCDWLSPQLGSISQQQKHSRNRLFQTRKERKTWEILKPKYKAEPHCDFKLIGARGNHGYQNQLRVKQTSQQNILKEIIQPKEKNNFPSTGEGGEKHELRGWWDVLSSYFAVNTDSAEAA